MPTKAITHSKTKAEKEIKPFKTRKTFETWLSKHFNTSPGIWIHFYKKDSDVATINHAEALDVALCYGWIDGQSDKYDDSSWLQKFTPRTARSVWSKRNTEHVERLTKAGRMKAAGLAEVEKAKADGRWAKAYDSPANMEVPEDFLKAVSKDKKAKAFFESLNKANRFSIAYRLQDAKKPETREKRMVQILEMMKKGEKFH